MAAVNPSSLEFILGVLFSVCRDDIFAPLREGAGKFISVSERPFFGCFRERQLDLLGFLITLHPVSATLLKRHAPQ